MTRTDDLAAELPFDGPPAEQAAKSTLEVSDRLTWAHYRHHDDLTQEQARERASVAIDQSQATNSRKIKQVDETILDDTDLLIRSLYPEDHDEQTREQMKDAIAAAIVKLHELES